MKKRVLIIIPTLANGGAERIASYLSTGLPREWQVDLLMRENRIDYTTRDNCCVTVTGGGISGIVKEYLFLRRAKRVGDYDIYNSHMASSNILNIFSGSKSGKRVLTIHAVTSMQMKEQRFGAIVNFIIRRFYSSADKIIAVSGAVKKDLADNYGIDESKIAAIDNGNDIERVRELGNIPLDDGDKAMLSGRPVITAMGRYTRAKGHITLIRAFSGVVKKYPDAKLLIIGEGELRGEYERTVSELSLEDNVILTGYRKNPFNIIKSSDMFVFSSLYEGYGCALAEAMFCGVPVISVNCPGVVGSMMNFSGECKGAVYLDSGVICPASDGTGNLSENTENELCHAIINVFEDPEYSKKCAEYNFSRENEFSLSRMTEKWTEILENL